MDLCTYDSLMIVKVADLSLYHNKQADLVSFLDVAVQMLAARVRDAGCAHVMRVPDPLCKDRDELCLNDRLHLRCIPRTWRAPPPSPCPQ